MFSEYHLHDRAFFRVLHEHTVYAVITIRLVATGVPTALCLERPPTPGTQSDVLSLLFRNEHQQRAVDVGEIITLRKMLLGGQQLHIPLLERVEVIEIQFCVTSNTVILEHNHGFMCRELVCIVENLVQFRAVVLRTADCIGQPAHDFKIIPVGVIRNRLFLYLDTVFIVRRLFLRRYTDITNRFHEIFTSSSSKSSRKSKIAVTFAIYACTKRKLHAKCCFQLL